MRLLTLVQRLRRVCAATYNEHPVYFFRRKVHSKVKPWHRRLIAVLSLRMPDFYPRPLRMGQSGTGTGVCPFFLHRQCHSTDVSYHQRCLLFLIGINVSG